MTLPRFTRHLTEPGPDGIYGTPDDVQMPLTNYQRKIEIQPVLDANGTVDPSLRAVNITVRYSTPRVLIAENVRTDFVYFAVPIKGDL